jgi:hypothetical protein
MTLGFDAFATPSDTSLSLAHRLPQNLIWPTSKHLFCLYVLLFNIEIFHVEIHFDS